MKNFTALEALAIIAGGDADLFVTAELAGLQSEIEAIPPHRELTGSIWDRFTEAFMAG